MTQNDEVIAQAPESVTERGMKLIAVTANRLGNGEVVYLTQAGDWSPALDDAQTVADEDAAEALMQQAREAIAARLVVGAYTIPLVRKHGILLPLSQRERIRAAGPTVRPDLGKQAAPVRSGAGARERAA